MKNFKLQTIRHPRNTQGEFTNKYPILDQIIECLATIGISTFIIGFIIFGGMVAYYQPNEVQEPLPTVNVAEAQIMSQGTIREVTMYSSTPEQTDATPCIGANGQDVCVLWASGQNLCATNAFPFGTELKIDHLGSCLTIDRMNKRYSNRIDWYAGYDNDCLDGVDSGDYCPTYQRALNFGLQNLLVTVK